MQKKKKIKIETFDRSPYAVVRACIYYTYSVRNTTMPKPNIPVAAAVRGSI